MKFGLVRFKFENEILDGHITMEEGIAMLTKFDGEFPEKYIKLFLDYCDITEDYF